MVVELSGGVEEGGEFGGIGDLSEGHRGELFGVVRRRLLLPDLASEASTSEPSPKLGGGGGGG